MEHYKRLAIFAICIILATLIQETEKKKSILTSSVCASNDFCNRIDAKINIL